jgi:hypothetical protein
MDGVGGPVNASFVTVGPYLRPGGGGSLLDVRLAGLVDIEFVTDVTFDPETCGLVKTTETVSIPTAIAKTRAPNERVGGPHRVVRNVF